MQPRVVSVIVVVPLRILQHEQVLVDVGVPVRILEGRGVDANNLPESIVANHLAVLILRWLLPPDVLVPSGWAFGGLPGQKALSLLGQPLKASPLRGAWLDRLANKIFGKVHQQVPGRGALKLYDFIGDGLKDA